MKCIFETNIFDRVMTSQPEQGVPVCVRACSILSQTTCQPVSRRSLMMDQDMIYSNLWSDGCYNSTLFQATEGYKTYQKVGKSPD